MPEKLIKFAKDNFALIIISTLALILRVVFLHTLPPSLNWDEASHGYNAYSILMTGRDEWGEFLPAIFRAYGDYKLPLYIYSTAVSVAIFGLNEFAIRLPSALAGVGTVVFTYLLVKDLAIYGLRSHSGLKNTSHKTPSTKHQTHALLSAFLVAVEPWSLFLSRGAFEANLALMLFVGGVFFFFKGLRIPKYYLLSAVFFGLTVWTYNSYRIFTPLMVLVLIVLHYKVLLASFKAKPLLLLTSTFLLLFLLIPMLYQLTAVSGQARYGKVAIIDEGAVANIDEQRTNFKGSPLVARLIHNKGVYFLKTVAGNWTAHYAPGFLFLEGGSQYQYSVQEHGLLYLVNLPFLFFGLWFVIMGAAKRKKYAWLLLAWFLLSPIPASITRDSPHALRTITMLPVPMIFTAIGIVFALQKISNNFARSTLMIYVILVFISLITFFEKYYNTYRQEYSWAWQYGHKQAVAFTRENYDKYDKIIITKKYGEPHIFYLLYWPWDPQDYMDNDGLVRFEQTDWFWVDRFDKFYFVNDWDIPTRSDRDFVLESGEEFDCRFDRCLLVTSPGTHQQDWKILKTVDYLDGQRVFEILENK
jgi:hypothetical protein